jgi:hypothetical protein
VLKSVVGHKGVWPHSLHQVFLGNRLAGTESRSVGGGYADETLTGKWTVNPDCTGTVIASFFEDGQLVRTCWPSYSMRTPNNSAWFKNL